MPDNSVGSVSLDLGLDSTKFNRQAQALEKTTKKQFSGLTSFLSNFLANVATSLLNQLLSQIGNFVTSAIDLASDLEEVENVVDTVFGNMQREVDAFAQSAMKSFGLSELVAKQYIGQLGAMAKAFGYSEQESYNLARSITGLTGDVASFYNLSTDEAFTKLKSIFTGETESLKSLGIVMTQSALDAYAMANGFGKTTSQMSESEKVALRYKFVMSQLGAAHGDFAKTSDSWANQVRVLGLQFDTLKSIIGEGFIAALTPVVRVLNELIVKSQQVALAFTNMIKRVMGVEVETEVVGSGLSDAAGSSGLISENMEDTAKSAEAAKKSILGFDQINKLSSDSSASSTKGDLGSFDWGTFDEGEKAGNQLADSITKSFDGFFENVKKKFDGFADKTGLSNLWADFIDGVGFAKSGVLNLFKAFESAVAENEPNIEEMKSSFVTAFLTMSQALTTVWGDMWLGMTQAFHDFTVENSASIQEFFSNIISIFTSLATLLFDIVGDIYGSVLSWWNEDGKRIWGEIVECLKDIGKWVLDLYNQWFLPVVDSVISVLSDLWENHLKPLWDEVLKVITSIGDYLLALWNERLKPFVDFVIAVFGPGFVNTFKSIFGVAKEIVGGIIDQVKAVLKTFRGIVDFLTGAFTGDWKKAWQGVQTIFSGIWDSIVTGLKTPINTIIAIIEGMVNGVIAGLNGMIRAINKISLNVPDWVPGIGGETIGFNLKEVSSVKIPRLAEGGFIRANQPTLAVIGDNKREGEIVAPESKIADAVARGVAQALSMVQGMLSSGGSNQPFQVVVQIGDEVIIDRVIRGINDENRRAGRLVITI